MTIFWMLLIFVGSSIPGKSMPHTLPPDYLSHFAEYFILGFFTNFWFSGKIFKAEPLKAFLATIGLCMIFGFFDEIHQSFVPGRCCDIRDWFADSLGGISGAFFVLIYLKHRQWQTKE